MNRVVSHAKSHFQGRWAGVDLLYLTRHASNLALRSESAPVYRLSPSKFGFEISASVNSGTARSMELQLLETVMVNECCDWIVGRSGKNVTAPYDCIHDIQIAEPLLPRVSLAHRLEMRVPSRVGDRPLRLDAYRSTVVAWASELREIRRSLGCGGSVPHPNQSPLSIISIPIQPIVQLCNENDSNWLDFAMELADETIRDLHLISGEDIGFAVPLEPLLSRDVCDAFRLDYDTGYGSVCNLVRELRYKAKGLFLPMNCFTSGSCSNLLSEINLPETVKTFAVDTLRYHPLRPGHLGAFADLSFSTDDFEAKHLPALRRSLDICMKLEKGYLTKFRESGLHNKVRTTSVCLGHVIAAQFSESAKRSIFTIDDWDFIRDNEVEPNFRASLDVIKSTSKEAAEWALVYEPIARRMLNDLGAVLQHQKVNLNKGLADAIIAQGASFSSWSNYLATYAWHEPIFDTYCFPDKLTLQKGVGSAYEGKLGSIFEHMKLYLMKHHTPP